ncbi:DUF2141 domain-containing protein [Prevotella corporis]
MNMRKILSLVICCISLGSLGNVFAQKEQALPKVKLKIKVQNVESNEGRIMIAVYNSKKTFLKKAFTVMSVQTDSISVRPAFLSLPKGVYAISLFQDANNNGKLDTGTFGIPTEKYGFSNNAEVFMGPPSFKSSSFNLDKDTTITINLR